MHPGKEDIQMTDKTTDNPDFVTLSHRLNTPPINCAQLDDCVNPALERAAAITDLVQVAVELNVAYEMPYLWRAAQAIRFEIMDAQAHLQAYTDRAKTTPEQADNAGGE
jgi:hypothetical protein